MNSKNSAREFWDERFGQPEFIYGETANEYLKNRLEGLAPGKILFPAEGEGRNAVHAAAAGWAVSAFDQSRQGAEKAARLAKSKAVEIDYIVSDIDEIDYPLATFDAIALVYAHFHGGERRAYHKKLVQYLKPGGVLILEAFDKSHVANQRENPAAGGPRDAEMLYDADEIAGDFEGFEFFESGSFETELREGDHHKGRANVVRIFARKL